jgi:hypothetical protein
VRKNDKKSLKVTFHRGLCESQAETPKTTLEGVDSAKESEKKATKDIFFVNFKQFECNETFYYKSSFR